MTTHEIRIDRSIPLGKQPETGHNRWHPDITPRLVVRPGDEVEIETRDAFDLQFSGNVTTPEEVAGVDLGLVHPLTGPVYVEGAEPGDLLVVDILEVMPAATGYTAQVPGFGFLRADFPDPYIVKWDLADGWATSKDLPGVRVPGAPFMGIMGLAPSHDLLRTITQREQALRDRGGFVLPPNPIGAVPGGAIAEEGLTTIPPRETGGNMDIKHTAAGARLFFPVFTPGALFSTGDAHFAQGDCEACGTAIEMGATLRCRFDLRKGVAAERGIRDVQFEREDYFLPPEFQAPRRFFATTGIAVDRDGTNHSENVTEAARNALRNMIDHLGAEYGFTRQQAYAICSVAVDLKISELVDVPNMIVSALLPLAIVEGAR
jgi:formamidase